MRDVGASCGTAALLQRVALGDSAAWNELVDLHNRLVWNVARSYSLSRVDAEDVCQATWLLLAEHRTRLREPNALVGWLVTTARRESLRLIRAGRRELPVGVGTAWFDPPDRAEGPEGRVMRMAANSRLATAFAGLSQRCQQLLRIVATAPETSYTQVSDALGIARGTVGPKKNRCLAALRERVLAVGGIEEVAG